MSAEYYFPPGTSLARRVHEQRAVAAIYGSRALLIGAMEPLTYTATMLSTRSRDYPFRRLARTAIAHEIVLLGTREEADAVLGAVHQLHRRVRGTLPTAAGDHPAGTPFSAFDQELMLWTLASIADSAQAIYEALVAPLSASERQELWSDYRRFGELFGLHPDSMPATYPEFRDWLTERLASPQLRPTAHALELAPPLAFDHPIPPLARPIMHLNNLIIKGTLPPRVRDLFAIRWAPTHERAFRSFTAFYRRAGYHLLPPPIRHGRTARFLERVIAYERERGGTPTPPLPGAQ